MNKRIGLLIDERFQRHTIHRHSPENPARLDRLTHLIRERYNRSCRLLPSRPAELTDILAVHSQFYLDQIKDHQYRDEPYSYDRDTYLMEHSLETAILAAGGGLELADHIMAGDLKHGFALVRPPGHHAEPGRGMGFCIFNNIAVTAQYLKNRYLLNRILIIDFDVHHANGTQEIFYEDDEVLVVSIHQRDIWPFTGKVEETGIGRGEGYTINLPVYAQFGDVEYTFLLGRILQSIVEQFSPQIILVSAGYDGHLEETISGTMLSTEWFGVATMMLKQFAQEFCEGRLLLILEGGYNPVSLEKSVLSSIEGLLSPRKDRIGILYSERASQIFKDHPLHTRWTV